MRLILVEDDRAAAWTPFAETRPVGELRFGAMLLRERVERWTGARADGYLTGGMGDDGWDPGPLLGFDEPGAPPILGGHPLDEDTGRDTGLDVPGARGGSTEGPGNQPPGVLFWLSRAAPGIDAAPPRLPAGRAMNFLMEGTLVGSWIPTPDPDAPADEAAVIIPYPYGSMVGFPMDGGELSEAGIDHVELRGTLLDWPWELVSRNEAVLREDLEWLHGHDRTPLPEGVLVQGEGAVSLGEGAEMGPGVVVDTRDGVVRLDAGVQVEGPARLTGPLHLGPGSQVFGGHLSRLSAGPVCKLRGEIDTAVLLGYDNKAHDGYLGHALLGRWVNLGALTTNSDLKNDYGPVRVELGPDPATGAARIHDTGRKKVGVFLGDHVKTGIGTVLNTGSVVGAGSNVFGGGMPAKHLPPFSWAGGGSVVPFRWEKFLEVARIVVARRDQPWTPGVEAVLRALWETTHGGDGGDGDGGGGSSDSGDQEGA